MTSSSKRRQRLAAFAGVFCLLLSGSSAAVFGQDPQALQPADEQRDGDFASDAVGLPLSQVVATAARAIVDRVLALAPVRFWTDGGNKAFVPQVYIVEPKRPTDCGIIVDDGVPF